MNGTGTYNSAELLGLREQLQVTILGTVSNNNRTKVRCLSPGDPIMSL